VGETFGSTTRVVLPQVYWGRAGSVAVAIAATTAAAEAAATAAAAAATTAALRSLLRLVDLDLTAVDRLTIELLNGLSRCLGRTHGHEGEPARLTRFTIGGHRHLTHLADGGEGGFNGGLRSTEREISYEETITHDDFFFSQRERTSNANKATS
jgi:hypothetical protein